MRDREMSPEERVELLRAWSAQMIGPIGVAAGPCSPDALRLLGELLVAQRRVVGGGASIGDPGDHRA